MFGGALQEVCAGGGLLVVVDFGVGEAGVVVDRGVDVFVADAAAGVLVGAGGAGLGTVAAVDTPAAAVA